MATLRNKNQKSTGKVGKSSARSVSSQKKTATSAARTRSENKQKAATTSKKASGNRANGSATPNSGTKPAQASKSAKPLSPSRKGISPKVTGSGSVNTAVHPRKAATKAAVNSKTSPSPKAKSAKSSAKTPTGASGNFSAAEFTRRLYLLQSDEELRKIQRYFKSGEGQYGEGDQFIGVRMGHLFDLAKTFIAMTPDQLEILMDSPIHELRAGAMSIMDKQGRNRKTSPEQRKALYELYLRRHDRINNWDLVDLAAQFVVGAYLDGKPKDPLYRLARSKNMWERRTAIVATAYFLRKGDTTETFKISEMLMQDKEDLIQKAAGGWLRMAGSQQPKQLLAFLDKYAAKLPRTFLRYAIERLSPAQKAHYMKPGKK
ncbi:hypothetical protein HHL16_21635 [Pseudoflavitalea sp. G-6-1-2]|uniref:DNA alkylation repair protein n=1 Tax=Pseudoflavitalea sp. G-6-1-2 TaxID=2728841 RepID=UPI00146A6EEE|nr:DNA alkylation repair protein [Pseudoflavitalea sp. G-6-1-2]NML23497.1 hypothetical protein [Pseudoflavitalea sp. G-6-1-2]